MLTCLNNMKLVLAVLMSVLLLSCQSNTTEESKKMLVESGSHKAWVSLTVAESKRLIALGLLEYPVFQERLEGGTIIVTKGTTNSYIASELLDTLDQESYVLGHILPSHKPRKLTRRHSRSELVLYKGKEVDVEYTKAFAKMKDGDIILKGANIINYSKGQAGVLIGHPTGGTCGKILPAVEEHNLRLIIPVGLEKESSSDIDLLSESSKLKRDDIDGRAPTVWSIKGELFTEIEAIKQFAKVEVQHFAAGGIGGAEGAVSLLITGGKKEVEKALALVHDVQGEEEFIKVKTAH